MFSFVVFIIKVRLQNCVYYIEFVTEHGKLHITTLECWTFLMYTRVRYSAYMKACT